MYGFHREKITAKVEFPLQGLDLSEWVLSPETDVYDLYAVSNHFGSLGGGHYTSYCFHAKHDQWYEFNDSKVTKINAEDTISPHAYILFYKKRKNLS